MRQEAPDDQVLRRRFAIHPRQHQRAEDAELRYRLPIRADLSGHAADALWFSVAEYACDSTHTRDGLEGRSGSSAGGRHPQGNRGWAGGCRAAPLFCRVVNVSQTSPPARFEIPELGRALHVVQAYALLNLIPASRIVPKIWAGILLALFGIVILDVGSFWRAAGRCLWIWVALAPGGLKRLGPWIGLGALITAVVGAVFDVQIQAETGLPGGRFTHSGGSRMAMLTLDWGDAASLVYVGIILLLCLVATPKKMRSRKLLVLALLAIVVAVATASFTAATGLLGITGLSLLVHEMVIRRKIVQAVLLGVVVLGTGYALTISDNPYSRQTMNRFTSLSETAMEGESLEDADDSGRWRAAMVSWRSFVSEPTFGIGAYYTMEYTDILGSHCSVLDWPAQYGLVGAFGPVLLFGIALVSSIKMGLRSLRTLLDGVLVQQPH